MHCRRSDVVRPESVRVTIQVDDSAADQIFPVDLSRAQVIKIRQRAHKGIALDSNIVRAIGTS